MFSRQFLQMLVATATVAAAWTGAARSAEKKISAADQKAIEALRSTTRIEFYEEKLQEVANYVKDRHKVDIQFDQKALDDAGIKTDVRITRNIPGVTLQSALRLILGQVGLAHVIRDGTILITTPERGRQLVRAGAIEPAGCCPPPAAKAQKIAQALKKPVLMAFVNESLANVIDYLMDYCKVEIQIDHRALKAARLSMDVPCTVNCKGISLEWALRLLLRELGMRYVVEDEWILVTAMKPAVIRPVGADAAGGKGRPKTVSDAQHRLIESEIQRIVREIKVFPNDEETAPLALLKGPLLRFEIKPSHVYGTVWAWGGPGRPQAVLSLALYGPPDNPFWLQEIVSLSTRPMCASARKRTWWAAEAPGWNPKSIPSSDAPAGDPEKRLLQMKALAARFTGWEFGRPGRPWGLDRLADPIYRYAGPTATTLDGAVFAFVDEGDKPEILLVIEAEKAVGGRAEWRYAAAPLAANGLIVKLDGKECWRPARINDRPTAPSDPYHFQSISAKEEIRRTEGKAAPSQPPARDPFAP